jgi:hypothetical protein
MSIQREQEKNVNQLKLIDNKIAKSNLASNEERLGNVGNNAIEDKKQKDMVLNSLLADTNVDNMILEALKQEIGREITDPNTLRKVLSSNPINYIYFFNNLITINLYSLESRTNIKLEEEIINVDNRTLLGCEDLCEEFEWLYQPYTEFIMESFTYGQNELEYNQNLNSKDKMKLHETTRYIGNKRRNISNWNILGKNKNTIGSNTINQIDDLFIKSTSNINVNKRKLLSVSEMKELSDRRLKEFEEKDKILNDEYLKIQRDKDKMQEMEIEIQEKK